MSSDDFKVHVRSKGYVKIPLEGRVFVDHEQVVGVDYSALALKRFGSHGSRFENCKFEGLRLDSLSFGAGKVPSEYYNCSFDGSTFYANTLLGRARFVGCTFRNIRSSRFKLAAGDLIDCVFTGKMDRTQIWGRTGPDADVYGDRVNTIEGNDFSGVDFGDTDFRFGVDLREQILPTGEDYLFIPDAGQVLARAYKEAVTMTDLETRAVMIRMIEQHQEYVAAGQRDLFSSKRRIPKFIRDDFKNFFDLISKHLPGELPR